MTTHPRLFAFGGICWITILTVAPAEAEQLFKLTASDAAPVDFFGLRVAISGDAALVSAIFDDDAGDRSGSAYLFDVNSGQQLHKLIASDGAAEDHFGFSLALDGGTAIIGAPGDDDMRGSAYLFDVETGQQLRKLTVTGADRNVDDLFGNSVALSGNLALVGAAWDIGRSNGSHVSGQGAAYVFDTSSGQQLRKLTPSDPGVGDWFGRTVALSGNIGLIGAPYDDDIADYSGSAYLFDVNTGQQLFKLTAPDAANSDQFGTSVAISGNIALVGAAAADNRRGAAYVFDVTTGQLLHKLTASDGVQDDSFGSVALSGNIAIIGAVEANSDRGAAYVFDVTTGLELAKLTATDGAIDDLFGSVAVSGGIAVIGANSNDAAGENAGAAYVFRVTVPEPSTLLMAALALLPVAWRSREHTLRTPCCPSARP